MHGAVTLATIGFTRIMAERFFGKLAKADVRTVLDTRLRTGGQLSGFAKTPDLAYFLREIGASAIAMSRS